MSAVRHLTPEQEIQRRVVQRADDKARWQKAREVAQARFKTTDGAVTVPETANVMLCPDGAYVEAMVWIGKDEL